MGISVFFVITLTLGLVMLYSHAANGSTAKELSAPCSKGDISIAQGQGASEPSGIPSFAVEITNTNLKASISNIHVRCGNFSSAIQINPEIFRRIAEQDCLVNNGNPLGPGLGVSFKYANTRPYPLDVSSITC